jgi:exportin-T
VAVDQDIISLDVPRSAEEAKQSMHFKDSMRERALADIAEAWCSVVAAYHATAPDTAAAVLDTVQRYVHWIDIGLVANGKFVPLLFSVLGAPQEGLRGAAADVLTEIVR